MPGMPRALIVNGKFRHDGVVHSWAYRLGAIRICGTQLTVGLGTDWDGAWPLPAMCERVDDAAPVTCLRCISNGAP